MFLPFFLVFLLITRLITRFQKKMMISEILKYIFVLKLCSSAIPSTCLQNFALQYVIIKSLDSNISSFYLLVYGI